MKICDRGRRSITRGRDAVGWFSFSVDKMTESKSSKSSSEHNTNINMNTQDHIHISEIHITSQTSAHQTEIGHLQKYSEWDLMMCEMDSSVSCCNLIRNGLCLIRRGRVIVY